MKKLFKSLVMLMVAVMLSTSFACTAPAPESSETPSGKIISRERIGYVTGPDYFTANNTKDNFGFAGTDLGFPVYDSTTEEMYVFFGDTFTEHTATSGDWRSNVMAISKDFDLSDGLDFIGIYTAEGKKYIGEDHGKAVAVAEGLHSTKKGEMTKIPTGAIEVNGNIYLFYFSKYSWNFKVSSMSYGGCVKSTDHGNTWERCFELTWTDHAEGTGNDYTRIAKVEGNDADNIEKIINQNLDGSANVGEKIDVAEHEGYFFTQIFPIDGKDGYIYIFGEGGYRTHGIKLGRVKVENFEDFESYEYFIGYDENEDPIWLPGREGLDYILYDDESFIVGELWDNMCGEHSVAYNKYLKKWILSYLSSDGLTYALAENIWGPYSKPMPLMQYNWDQLTSWEGKRIASIYGGFIHEKWMEEDGKVMYCTYSQFTPIYNSSIMKVTFE